MPDGQAAGGVDRRYRQQVIDGLRLVLIVLMIAIHIPWNVDPAIPAALVALVRDGRATALPFDPVQHMMIWLRFGLAGGAVSLLTVISAWLTIVSLEKRGKWSVARSKAKSLMRPYIVWCALYALVSMRLTGVLPGFDAIFGIGRWPLNFPLHFLIDLFEATLIFVAFYPLLRGRPGIALVFAFLLGGYALYAGSGVGDYGANAASPLPRAAILFIFFLGAAIFPLYRRLFEKRSVDRLTAPSTLALLALVAILCSYVKLIDNALAADAGPLAGGAIFLVECGARLAGGMLILALVMLAMRRRPFSVNRRLPFRIFASHGIALLALSRLPLFAELMDDRLGVFFLVYAAALGFGLTVHGFAEGAAWLGRLATRTPEAEKPAGKRIGAGETIA